MKQMGILRNSSRLIRENISCYTHLIFTINQDDVDVNKVIIKIKKAKTALQLCGISCHHSILLFMVEFSGCHKMLYINCVTYYCSFQITCILYTCFLLLLFYYYSIPFTRSTTFMVAWIVVVEKWQTTQELTKSEINNSSIWTKRLPGRFYFYFYFEQFKI